jgi:hypothetical protein
MSVFRVEKTKNYTVMSNYHLRDRRLSLKSTGLLSLMLSLPEDWNYTCAGLTAICKDGKESIRSAIQELESAGYIVRRQERDECGRMSNSVYTIYEYPQSDSPLSDLPPSLKPSSGNPPSVKPISDLPPQRNTYKQIPEKGITDYTNPSINQSGARTDSIDTIEVYRRIVKDNIGYDAIRNEYEQDRLDEIVEIMLECICSSKDVIRIAKEDVPKEVVKSRFLKIDSSHIEYVFYCLGKNTTKVRNIKEYLKTSLYNSVSTISNFYSAEVNHDLYGSKG